MIPCMILMLEQIEFKRSAGWARKAVPAELPEAYIYIYEYHVQIDHSK